MPAQTSHFPTSARRKFRVAAAALVVLLAVCEVAILQQYLGVVQPHAELSVELEYARGATLLAQAQARRCLSQGEVPVLAVAAGGRDSERSGDTSRAGR